VGGGERRKISRIIWKKNEEKDEGNNSDDNRHEADTEDNYEWK
jgi:hypothetical protein